MQEIWHIIKSKEIQFCIRRRQTIGTYYPKRWHKDRSSQGRCNSEDSNPKDKEGNLIFHWQGKFPQKTHIKLC